MQVTHFDSKRIEELTFKQVVGRNKPKVPKEISIILSNWEDSKK